MAHSADQRPLIGKKSVTTAGESVMRTVVTADLDPPAMFSSAPQPPLRAEQEAFFQASRRLARWLLALLLLGLLLGGGAWLAMWLLAPEHMTLSRVRIDGTLHHTSRAALQQALSPQVHGSFFALDIGAIRHALQALPWVAQASVRRVWPLALAVQIQEREALAHWGERALVSPEGDVFTPDPDSVPSGLVQLQGPEGSALEVIKRYHKLQALFAPYPLLKIAQLNFSPRRAWSIQTVGGLRLSLGTSQIDERIARFLDYFPRLPQPEGLEQIDLRYTNGFAVRWRATPVVMPVKRHRS